MVNKKDAKDDGVGMPEAAEAANASDGKGGCHRHCLKNIRDLTDEDILEFRDRHLAQYREAIPRMRAKGAMSEEMIHACEKFVVLLAFMPNEEIIPYLRKKFDDLIRRIEDGDSSTGDDQ